MDNSMQFNQMHQTNLFELVQQLAVTYDDDSQRQDEAGKKECDDESVVMRVTRVPIESPNQVSIKGQVISLKNDVVFVITDLLPSLYRKLLKGC